MPTNMALTLWKHRLKFTLLKALGMYFRFLHCNNPILYSLYLVSTQYLFRKKNDISKTKIEYNKQCWWNFQMCFVIWTTQKFSFENKCTENISNIRELKFPQKYYRINLTNKYQLFKMKGFKSFSGRSILCR